MASHAQAGIRVNEEQQKSDKIWNKKDLHGIS